MELAPPSQAVETPVGTLLATPPPTTNMVPPGGVLYKVDSSHGSFGELWRDTRSPVVLIAWIAKLLRCRLPGSVNDPNVESLRPFEKSFADLPAEVRARIDPKLRELQAFGFDPGQPITHIIIDLFNNSRSYIVTLPRPDGRAVARVVLRTEGAVVPPKTHFYCDLLTELPGGRFLWTTGARATLNAPPTISVRQQVDATPSQLWSMHQQEIQGSETAGGILPASDGPAVLELVDRHHATIRDLHLSRRLFVPMSVQDDQNAAAIASSYAQGAAAQLPYPEILAEMERLQTRQTGWLGGLIVLGISLLLFIAAGVGGDAGIARSRESWEALALLVPILLIHELGHFLAMRLFHYRNVRMFFIPFLGAAVSGQGYSAPGWKKVVVALMGPLPGILIGAVLGIAGAVLHHPLLIKAALMAVILNGFNLLPVLPLDGGRVVQHLLFCRHYALDIVFRLLAAAALLAASLGGGRIFLLLGIVMLISIPAALRVGRVAADLKRQGMVPPPPDQQGIPLSLAGPIIERVRAAFARGRKANNRALAQHSLSVYEALCARPPGWAATIGFGTLHVGAIVISVVLAIVLFIAQGGSLTAFARAAANQPRYSIAPSDIIVLAPHGEDPQAERRAADWPRTTLIANFPKRSGAENAFTALSSRLAAGQTLQRFGQTLLVALPAADDAARRQWIAALELHTPEVAVYSGGESGFGGEAGFGGANFTLTCLAPDAAAAQAVQEELDEYLSIASLHLIPPWSPLAASPDWPKYRLARRTYQRLLQAGRGAYADPRVRAVSDQMALATRHGDKAELKRLRDQWAQQIEAIRQEELHRLGESTDSMLDQAVVAEFLKLPRPGESDEEDEPSPFDFTSPPYQAIAARMGQIPLAGAKPAPGADRYCTLYGSASRQGLLITFHWTSFVDPAEGAPALVRWLADRGCASMKYEFPGPNQSSFP